MNVPTEAQIQKFVADAEKTATLLNQIVAEVESFKTHFNLAALFEVISQAPEVIAEIQQDIADAKAL